MEGKVLVSPPRLGKVFFVCPVLPLHSLWSVRYLRFRNCGDFGLRRRRRPRLIDGPPSSSLPLHRRDRRRKREGSGKIRHRLQNSFDFRLYANLQVSSKMSMSMAYSSTSSWSNVVHRVPLSDRLQSPTQFVHCLFLSRLRGLLTREKHVLAGKSVLSSFFIHAKKRASFRCTIESSTHTKRKRMYTIACTIECLLGFAFCSLCP